MAALICCQWSTCSKPRSISWQTTLACQRKSDPGLRPLIPIALRAHSRNRVRFQTMDLLWFAQERNVPVGEAAQVMGLTEVQVQRAFRDLTASVSRPTAFALPLLKHRGIRQACMARPKKSRLDFVRLTGSLHAQPIVASCSKSRHNGNSVGALRVSAAATPEMTGTVRILQPCE